MYGSGFLLTDAQIAGIEKFDWSTGQTFINFVVASFPLVMVDSVLLIVVAYMFFLQWSAYQLPRGGRGTRK